jgi:hypothetical protein
LFAEFKDPLAFVFRKEISNNFDKIMFMKNLSTAGGFKARTGAHWPTKQSAKRLHY